MCNLFAANFGEEIGPTNILFHVSTVEEFSLKSSIYLSQKTKELSLVCFIQLHKKIYFDVFHATPNNLVEIPCWAGGKYILLRKLESC